MSPIKQKAINGLGLNDGGGFVCDELRYTRPVGPVEGAPAQFSASAQSKPMRTPSADGQEEN